MRAVVIDRFGGNEVLRVTQVADPLVGPDSVLVRTAGSSVNPVDWKIVRGYLQRVFPHHLPLVPGWDLSGTVEAVGPAVREFTVGDRVVGYVREDHVQNGTYAELVSAPLRTLAHAPRDLDLVHAAGLPLAGLTAYQALAAVKVTGGETLLVHAGAGGVGTFAVQLAAHQGVRVLATCSPGTADLVRELGGEPVPYGDDLVSDVRALAPGGIDASLDFVGGDSNRASGELTKDPARVASVVSPKVTEHGGIYVFVRPDADDLAALIRLVEAGSLRVVIDRVLAMSEVARAFEISEAGHVHGKLVLDAAAL